jgi:hypothetical protein
LSDSEAAGLEQAERSVYVEGQMTERSAREEGRIAMSSRSEAMTVGVYLSSAEFIRNYVRSGALRDVVEHHRVVVVLPESLQNHPGVRGGIFVGIIPVRVPAGFAAVEALLQDARTHRFRSRSSSFFYRHERLKERASRASLRADSSALRLRPLDRVRRWSWLHGRLAAVIA